jgi:hypothetical protein
MNNSKKFFISTKKIYIGILIIFLFCAFLYFFYRKSIIENAQSEGPAKVRIKKFNNKNKKTYPGIKVIGEGDYNPLYKKLVDYQIENSNPMNLVKNVKNVKHTLITFDKKITVLIALEYLNKNSLDLGIAQYSPST